MPASEALRARLVDEDSLARLHVALERASRAGVAFHDIWPGWLERAASCFEPRDEAWDVLHEQREGYRSAYEASV